MSMADHPLCSAGKPIKPLLHSVPTGESKSENNSNGKFRFHKTNGCELERDDLQLRVSSQPLERSP